MRQAPLDWVKGLDHIQNWIKHLGEFEALAELTLVAGSIV